jgi:ATP-dependent Clp protease ATP-binding subunit ClpC
MRAYIPILCTRAQLADSPAEEFRVSPLFIPDIRSTRGELQRAVNSVTAAVRRSLSEAGSEARHDRLAEYLFAPEMTEHNVTLKLQLRRRSPEVRYLFAEFRHGGSRYGYLPAFPLILFELRPGESLPDRATEVMSAFHREQESRGLAAHLEIGADPGKSWLSTIEINFDPPAAYRPEGDDDMASIGSFDEMDGADELYTVGRNLTIQYPDGLSRAVLRDSEVQELLQLTARKDNRPLLLLGSSGVGKTSVIHETVYRMVAERGYIGVRENVWLISPQRLISGMMFVGQWESRLHAILAECRRRNHILYFDDLVGLFRAGISASGKLSVGHVLKPQVEQRQVRVIAEATPEVFRALQEIDRSFADLFQVVPVNEMGEQNTARVLVHAMRAQESSHQCRFTPEVLPTVLELTSHYRREVANPGKSAAFLEDLAVQNRKSTVTRAEALGRFSARTGMRLALIDDEQVLPRDHVVSMLRSRIVGQDRAVNALADIVQIAKARLNDPGAPLGSCLFLGPTGVGKTECAKALARFLYDDESRLLRFDMNEFPEPWSVTRLVGTLSQPEGLLTSAVRRQPHSVILLDEIEKAHPSAFDLLLQVLGEGRLTDALGCTADFSNCIIIMTSNLGATEAAGGMGFAGHDVAGDEAYVQAARKFFRPEFFNRLNHIIPFQRLNREQVGRISNLLLREILGREGLARRRCVLHVEPAALEHIVDAGFNPALGARAIRRELERRIVQPLAVSLAGVRADAPMLVSLLAGKDDVVVGTREMRPAAMPDNAAAIRAGDDPDEVLNTLDLLLNRADAVVEELKPEHGVSAQDVSGEHRRYFAIRDLTQSLDDAIERFLDWREAADRHAEFMVEGAAGMLEQRPARVLESEFVNVIPDAWMRVQSEAELRALLLEKGGGLDEPEVKTRLRRLLASAGLLSRALVTQAGEADERVLLLARPLNDAGGPVVEHVMTLVRRALGGRFDLGLEPIAVDSGEAQAVEVSGYLASVLAGLCAGTHLGVRSDGVFPVVVTCHDTGAEPAAETVRQLVSRRAEWMQALVDDGTQAASGEEHALPPMVQVHFEGGQVLDQRNLLVSREAPSAALLGTWLGGLLPLALPAQQEEGGQ